MKHAIYQMDVEVLDPATNRKKIREWAEYQIAETNPDTIVLPEMWNAGYALDQLEEAADQKLQPTYDFLSHLAWSYQVNIIGGSVANQQEDGIYNSNLVFNRKGEQVHQYDKMHLVPMLDEPKYLQGGNNRAELFELDHVKMGVVICYDLRFPELMRSLTLQGAEVIYVVAQWPAARRNHWTYLLHARAIENQCYIVSCNSSGECNGTQFAGESLVIDPLGELVADGPAQAEATIHAEVDLEKVRDTRKQIPVFESRVPKLYDNHWGKHDA
ncbi:hypothetical protein J416_15592 [Gracilibacillus halophilus YIM-C55.5]|uniref:CN hydrolase domain-containing protein n=1 Tax=Gracilibacillus halophilus YIM-C55.5 TaxID=1308866 RepID=N4W8J2_9BACI|nr:carbon-nitrogen family hydrolase [Gracilibacillus halophilus]ENH95529.1 hypothetical protein J416_15592 [Gracilibacillus halophilus YIM-C55.5]